MEMLLSHSNITKIFLIELRMLVLAPSQLHPQWLFIDGDDRFVKSPLQPWHASSVAGGKYIELIPVRSSVSINS